MAVWCPPYGCRVGGDVSASTTAWQPRRFGFSRATHPPLPVLTTPYPRWTQLPAFPPPSRPASSGSLRERALGVAAATEAPIHPVPWTSVHFQLHAACPSSGATARGGASCRSGPAAVRSAPSFIGAALFVCTELVGKSRGRPPPVGAQRNPGRPPSPARWNGRSSPRGGRVLVRITTAAVASGRAQGTHTLM